MEEDTHCSAATETIYFNLPDGVEADKEEDHVSVAGRIIARRTFGTLRDSSTIIQLYCKKVRLSDDGFDQIKGVLDIGDIVGAAATVKRTEKGELSVYVNKLSILTKILLPLPEKWHGLTDIEKQYHQRSIDMIVNPEVADVFRSRAKGIEIDRLVMLLPDSASICDVIAFPYPEITIDGLKDLTQRECKLWPFTGSLYLSSNLWSSVER